MIVEARENQAWRTASFTSSLMPRPAGSCMDLSLLHLVVHGTGSADLLGPVLAVEALELGAQEVTVVEARVAVYTEQDLLRASWVQVVVHHEVEQFFVFLPDLVHELGERDAPRDQTLARLPGVELTQTA